MIACNRQCRLGHSLELRPYPLKEARADGNFILLSDLCANLWGLRTVNEWVSVAWVLAPLEVCRWWQLHSYLWFVCQVVSQGRRTVSNLSVAWVVCVSSAPLEFACAMKIAKPSWKLSRTCKVTPHHLCFSSVIDRSMRPRPLVAHHALTLPLGVTIPKPPRQALRS